MHHANTILQSNEVLNEETCDLVWDRCHEEIIKGETKHLIVLSSVPVAYPRAVCEILFIPPKLDTNLVIDNAQEHYE